MGAAARDRVDGEQLMDAIRAVNSARLRPRKDYGFVFTSRECPEGFLFALAGRDWPDFASRVYPLLADFCQRNGLPLPSKVGASQLTLFEVTRQRDDSVLLSDIS